METMKQPNAHVVCGSIQSIALHLDQFKDNDFDYLIVDEAHHAVADTYQKVLAYFKPSFTLGLTATPERTDDNKAILDIFKNTAHINNVRLSRCFFFVSDVLRQVIENGGTKSAVNKKPKKLPLEIPMEKRSQFAYTEVPIPASEIAKRINALADNDTMQKLTYSGILTWLTEIGMMEWALTPDGKRAKRPTKIGEETGISVEERTSSNGPYQVVVYNNAAQHFIIDNLDAILTAENMQTEMVPLESGSKNDQ